MSHEFEGYVEAYKKYGSCGSIMFSTVRFVPIIAELEDEIKRLKEGKFTPEEFQNLCHTKQVQDGFEAFCQGCIEYQKQLFQRTIIDKLAQGLYDCGTQIPEDKPVEVWKELLEQLLK